MAPLTPEELRTRTFQLRWRAIGGEPAESLLAEAFALVREAGRRIVGRAHHDVQVVAGAAVQAGLVASMKTSAGGPMTLTLPAFLDALADDGVHVVTNDDEAAQRDAAKAGAVLRALGLEVGVVAPGMGESERRAAYASDVTYGSYTQFGFDYLRDHLVSSPAQLVRRATSVALSDRADAVLVAEARTPLLIGGKVGGDADDRAELARVTVRGYFRQYAKLGGLSSFGAWPSTLAELEYRWGLELLEVPATVGAGGARPNRARTRGSLLPDQESLLLDLEDVDDDTVAKLYEFRDDVLQAEDDRLRDLMRGPSGDDADRAWDARLAELTPEAVSHVARLVLLRCIDQASRQYLAARRDREWPCSADRSAWPRELAEHRERERKAFDARMAEIRRDAVRYFLEVKVEINRPR